MDTKVTFQGLGSWQTGENGNIMDVEWTLGQQGKSNTIKVILADPKNTIGESLVKHSLASGGIQALTTPTNNAIASDPNPAPSNTSTVASGNGTVSRGAGFTNEVLAFMDLIAFKEVPIPLGEQGYYANNFSGYFDDQDIKAGGGFPASAGTRMNVGRYQFNRGDWRHARETNKAITGYSPKDQDLLCLWKLGYRKALAPLAAGDIVEAIDKAAYEWASLPGKNNPRGNTNPPQVQAGYTMALAVAYYKERLAYYQGQSGAVTTPQPVAKVEPQPSATTEATPEVVKGNKIILEVGNYSYEFYHSGTDINEDGKTQIDGQGVRWIMNRRKRNKTLKDVTLKQIATQFTAAHKLKLDYQADFNPAFEHIDQSGISDYQLLKREVEAVGLWVSEDTKGALTIKNRQNIKDTGFVIEAGVNLISYNISDRALDANNAESSLLQDEPKADINPMSGQIQQKLPDIDPVRDKSTTGKATQEVSGKPAPGQDAAIAQNKARMKRLKGLPSSFTVLLSDETLALQPLQAVRTKGFPGILSRVWVIDEVSHKLSDGTTIIKCYSPVEVVDNTPAIAPTPVATPTAATQIANLPPGKWLIPTSGQVTSPYGMRKGRMHNGIDISVAGGVIVAAGAGTVIRAEYFGGYGYTVDIDHGGGNMTRYAHMLAGSMTVRRGQSVAAGQKLGIQGNTGASRGVHLHFEHRINGAAINPLKLYPPLVLGRTVTAGTPRTKPSQQTDTLG